ncbi:MAG: asparagine synthase (glutamine-hydrolyzing) [Blastocatellales bacterium]
MCGICGVAVPKQLNRQVDRSGLIRMRDTMAHRGPDEEGMYLRGAVGLGHRRLSIVDVSGGHQPMSNGVCGRHRGDDQGGAIWIAFNGEIYNHPQLRPMLESRGHRYSNNSDTETIIHLYEERGSDVVEELSGMFAFAIWDETRQKLLLARDRLGIKPLYYFATDDGALYFASEIKSLLASLAIKPEVNLRALPDYLANHAPTGDETLFRGIKRLPPGHTLTWRDGKISVRKYWDLTFNSGSENGRRDDDYIAEWRELFRDAVRSHLMSDVPLGVFLSGGIDSSAIAATMSRMVNGRIKTFSVGFNEAEANELEYARLVSRAYGTEHYEVTVTPEEFFDALPRMVWHEDEPLAFVASVPLHAVSELAARHVKVVLTGEGSDEMLAGYDRYRKTVANLAAGAAYHNIAPAFLRNAVKNLIERAPFGTSIKRKLSRTFLCLRPELDEIYFDNFAIFSRPMQAELLTPAATGPLGSLDPYSGVRDLISQTDADTLLNRLLYADTRTYLHELLMKQDQMSMAASLESRVPFLDWRLVEFTARLPERLKLHGWTTKYILRQAMKDILPQKILTRRKVGFPVPVGAWLRGKFKWVVDEYVLSNRAGERGLFNRDFVQRMIGEHLAGADHSYRLWSLINFEIWMRQFIDGEAAPASRNNMAFGATIR